MKNDSSAIARRRLVLAGLAGAAVVAGVPTEAAAAPTGEFGWSKNLSTFDGSTDDAKLTAAMAYIKSLPNRGVTIVLDEAKTYTFSQPQQLFSGFSLSGPYRTQDQARSTMPVGNRINVRTSGPWFTLPAGQTFGVSLANLSLDGTATSALVGGGSGVLWTSVFHNISAQNFGCLFGSSASKLLNTACTFSGWWNVNNVQSRAWVVGGSDTNFAFTQCLLDSPTSLLGPTQFLAEFSSQSKGTIQNVYVTAEGHAAFRWTGGADRTVVSTSRIEGRNAGAPSPGALCRVEGSDVTFRDCWLSYAMANPTATGRNDSGVVHVSGGNVLLDGIDYERATGVSEAVPLLYASGGRVRVRNVYGRGFSGKPVVRQAVSGLIDADDSVTVTTG